MYPLSKVVGPWIVSVGPQDPSQIHVEVRGSADRETRMGLLHHASEVVAARERFNQTSEYALENLASDLAARLSELQACGDLVLDTYPVREWRLLFPRADRSKSVPIRRRITPPKNPCRS